MTRGRIPDDVPDVPGWVHVCDLDEIPDGRGRPVTVRGTEVALMRDGDQVFGLGNLCPHRGGQIGDGTVVDGKAICPMHSWDFDLRTGVSPFNPQDRVETYAVRVVDGHVEIDTGSVPRGPGRPDVYLGRWTRRGATDRGMYEVHHLASGLGPAVEAMGSLRTEAGARTYVGLDDVVFLPAQVSRTPLLDDEVVDTSVLLGTRAARPLALDIPLLVSHMSFGAISREAKVALATGARNAGTATCSGEGGVHPDERAAAGAYVLEMASGYFGWTEDAIAGADAVEIKIGQGAKPGMGGTLPGSKVTGDVARLRGLPEGRAARSPARFPDIEGPRELARRIAWIRSVHPDIPVGLKFAAGDVEADTAAALEAGADYLVVDGLGGGTGAAPVHVKDNVGIPSPFAVHRVRTWLDAHGVDDVQVVSTGGYRTAAEMAKGLALGADAIALATGALMAIGCQQYRACHRGTCPVGIATTRPDLTARLDPVAAAPRLTAYLLASSRMIVDFCRLAGRRSVRDLSRADLATLRPEIAARTGLPFVL